MPHDTHSKVLKTDKTKQNKTCMASQTHEWHVAFVQACSQGPAMHPSKSAKKSTFSHKMGKNGVFVGGLRGRGSKSPLLGPKGPHFGSAPP